MSGLSRTPGFGCPAEAVTPGSRSRARPRPDLRPRRPGDSRAGGRPEHPARSPSFCIQAGGNGSRTSSKWWFAITASRNGLGRPFLFVLPSFASPNIVSISASNCSAGLTTQRNRAAVSEAFQNLCAVPGSTVTDVPAGGDDRLAADLEHELALEHLEDLGLVRVQVGGGDEAVRLDEHVDHDTLPVRVGGGLDEADRLAGDAVVDDVSGADHGVAPCLGGYGWTGAAWIAGAARTSAREPIRARPWGRTSGCRETERASSIRRRTSPDNRPLG